MRLEEKRSSRHAHSKLSVQQAAVAALAAAKVAQAAPPLRKSPPQRPAAAAAKATQAAAAVLATTKTATETNRMGATIGLLVADAPPPSLQPRPCSPSTHAGMPQLSLLSGRGWLPPNNWPPLTPSWLQVASALRSSSNAMCELYVMPRKNTMELGERNSKKRQYLLAEDTSTVQGSFYR
jgi:hypothetical protein